MEFNQIRKSWSNTSHASSCLMKKEATKSWFTSTAMPKTLVWPSICCISSAKGCRCMYLRSNIQGMACIKPQSQMKSRSNKTLKLSMIIWRNVLESRSLISSFLGVQWAVGRLRICLRSRILTLCFWCRLILLLKRRPRVCLAGRRFYRWSYMKSLGI